MRGYRKEICISYSKSCSFSRAMRDLRGMFNVIKVYPMIHIPITRLRRLEGSIMTCMSRTCRRGGVAFGISTEETGGDCPTGSVRVGYRIKRTVLRTFPRVGMSIRGPRLHVGIRVHRRICVCSEVVPKPKNVPVKAGKDTVLLLSKKVSDPITKCVMSGHNIRLRTACFRTPPCADRETGRGMISLTELISTCSKPVGLRIIGFASVRLCVCRGYPRSRLAVVVHHCVVGVTRRFTGGSKYLNLVAKRDVNRMTDRAVRDLTSAGTMYALPICHPLVKFSGGSVMRVSRGVGACRASVRPFRSYYAVFITGRPIAGPGVRQVRGSRLGLTRGVSRLVRATVSATRVVRIGRKRW